MSKLNGNTKYNTVQEQEIAGRFKMWLSSLPLKGKEVLVTREQFVKLWVDSGKWEEKGKAAGLYTCKLINDVSTVTIDDIAITQQAYTRKQYIKKGRKPPKEKPPKVKKERKVPKVYEKSEKQKLKEAKKPVIIKETKSDILEISQRKAFKDPQLQQKFDEAVNTRRTNYKSIDLIRLGIRKVHQISDT